MQIDFDKFFGYLLSLKDRSEDQQHRIHVEPRLTTQLTADIESVCSVDFTSSYINWAIASTGKQDKNRFEIKQWSSIEVDLYGKYNFIKTFNKLSEGLSKVPLNDANVILVEQATYRYSNMKIATYVSQLQQIRAVLNTILHSQVLSKQPVYHISGRDVATHFGLFVGNEQSSAEFFLTNVIFNNTDDKQKLLLDVDHQLKTSYHGSTKGQKEPMAQCLLRAVAFLQCVNEKKSLFSHKS